MGVNGFGGLFVNSTAIQPLGERILVKVYERPAMTPGGIHLPGHRLTDDSWTLYEAVKASPKAEERLGQRIGVGDILRTNTCTPVDTGLDDPEDRRKLFFITAEQVRHITRNTWSNDDDQP